MPSMGSLPSVIDAKTDGSLLLLARNLRGPRFKFLECRQRSFLELAGSRDSAFGFLRVVGKECARFSLCCERRRHRGDSVRARVIGKGSADDGDSESEDALQATIEKSKQVLAKQRDLLQQISERRKLISSINSSSSSSSIINRETTEVSSEGNNGTFSTQSSASTSDSVEDHSSEGTLSRNDVHSSIDEVPEFLLSPVSKGFTEKKEPETSIPPKQNPLGVSSTKQASTADEVPEFLRAPVSRGFNQNKKEPGTSSPSKQTPLSVGSAKTAPNLEIPSFLSFSSAAPSVEDIKDEIWNGSGLPEKDGDTNEPVIEDNKPPPLAGANVMNVILVAAECAPWSKTGGLGDVAGALPKALAKRGHRVMVVVPRYDDYAEVQNTGVRKRYKVEGQDMEVVYYHTFIDGVDFVFIEGPMFRHLDNNIYGGSRMDILKRMVLFCKAAVEVPWHVPCGGVRYGDGNLVFIANDWHTALLPVYLKAYYRDNGLMSFTRSVLVIHNIAHQGRGPVSDFSCVDLPPHYLDLFKLYDPLGGDHFNIFAAGLKTADRVVTVSHGYAWEIKTSEGGWGLHGIINENDWKLTGIVNGIDSRDWNPQFDTHLTSDGYSNYSLETLQTGKPQCKAALQKELGLPVRDDVPLIGFIGRLDHQKGVDLIGEAIPWMMEQGVQLVMLGTGRADLEQMLRHFENQYNDKIRGWVGFSVKTAHRITAGADILLMPSRFEPCGLNQLYAMNYGTVPVVHAVGGLRDTVQQFDPYSESGLGWTFDSAETGKLIHALGNCLLTYREYKKSWEGLQRRGMMQDLSWDNVAHAYEEVLVAAKYQW